MSLEDEIEIVRQENEKSVSCPAGSTENMNPDGTYNELPRPGFIRWRRKKLVEPVVDEWGNPLI